MVELQSDPDVQEYRSFQRFKLMMSDLKSAPDVPSSSMAIPSNLANPGHAAADDTRGAGYGIEAGERLGAFCHEPPFS